MANSYIKLQVKSSGQYLNIYNGGNYNGREACQGVLATTNNFLWEIKDAKNNKGWFLIQVRSSGQYLNIIDGGNKNGEIACQGILSDPNTAPANFLWQFSDAPHNPGWSLIKVKSSGQYLNIYNGGNKNGKIACQGNRPVTPNFFWQKDNVIHAISVSATIAHPFPPILSDDEGHLVHTPEGDEAMTTEVAPGDIVVWEKDGDISSLDDIFETVGNDLFSTDPIQLPNGTWLGVVGALPPGAKQSYSIKYQVIGAPNNPYTQDPQLRMR